MLEHLSHLSVCLSVCLSICPVGELLENGWLDLDAIWGGEWGQLRDGWIRWGPYHPVGRGGFGALLPHWFEWHFWVPAPHQSVFFLQAGCPSCYPTNSVYKQITKDQQTTEKAFRSTNNLHTFEWRQRLIQCWKLYLQQLITASWLTHTGLMSTTIQNNNRNFWYSSELIYRSRLIQEIIIYY